MKIVPVASLLIALALALPAIPAQAQPSNTAVCQGNAGPPRGTGNIIDSNVRPVFGTDGDFLVMEWYDPTPYDLTPPRPYDAPGWLFQGVCDLLAQILKCLRDVGNPACNPLLAQLPPIDYEADRMVYLQDGATSGALTQEALLALYYPT